MAAGLVLCITGAAMAANPTATAQIAPPPPVISPAPPDPATVPSQNVETPPPPRAVTAPAAAPPYGATTVPPGVPVGTNGAACGTQACGTKSCGVHSCGTSGCGACACGAPACGSAPHCCGPVCKSGCCGTCGTECRSAHAGSACGPIQWDDPCGDCGPVFGAEFNWLILQREHPGSAPIFITPTGATLLNAREFTPSPNGGVELSLWFRVADDLRLQGRWFRLFEGEDRKSQRTNAGDALATNPPTVRLAPRFEALVYRSELQSAEIGLARVADDVLQLGLGLRYLELNEQLRDDQTAAVPLGFEQFTTQNDLFGAQITASYALVETEFLRVTAFGDAGLYANRAQSTASAQLGGLGLSRQADDSTTGTAFIGELGLNAHSRITESLWMTMGYRLIYLDGVALASDQIGRTTALETPGNLPRTRTDKSGEALLHGLSLGLELRY